MGQPRSTCSPEGARILVVEDEPIVSETLQMTLEEMGYQVVAAVATGEEAIDEAAQARPDLVIMDIGLPGEMDGVEAALRIQSDFDIPVVYLSALADDDLLKRAEVDAPHGYILKPFKPRDLHVTIRMALQRKCQEGLSRQRAEGLLRMEKDTAQKYLDVAGVILIALNRAGEITLINPKGCKALGYEDPQELLGRNWFRHCLTPEAQPEVEEVFRRLMAGEAERFEHFENTIRTRSGERRSIAWHNVLLRDERGNVTGALCSGEDVTEQRKIEEDLHKEKAFSDAAIESLPGIFYVLDENLRPLKWNRNLERSSGYSAREISEMKAADFFVEEDRERLIEKIEEAFVSKQLSVEVRFATKDGRAIPYHYRGVRMDIDGQKLLVGLGLDISERIRAEETKAELESRLLRAQKMEAIGTLAGGIAHDFNNFLAAMIGYAELAHLDTRGNPAAQQSLEEVLKAGKRAKELTKQILLFSRRTDRKRKPLLVHLILKEAMHLMRATIPTTIEIHQKIDLEAARVLADPTEIHQIVINLCTNAKDAMESEGGVLEVELTEEIVDTGHGMEHPGPVPGPYVKLTVRDSGQGMEREVLDRVFDPFFTTKEPGRGTGMGLSVAHGIVENLGGTISVESVPGTGTVFEVLLPKFDEDASSEEPYDRSIPTGQGRILLVDDEPAVVDAYRKIIENLGYEVVALTGSLEALEAFLGQPDKFDLVITDMTMPKLTGMDLAREVLRVRPETPVLLCTGFSEEATWTKAKQIGITDLLMKPISQAELAVAIQSALHERAGRSRAPALKIAAGV